MLHLARCAAVLYSSAFQMCTCCIFFGSLGSLCIHHCVLVSAAGCPDCPGHAAVVQLQCVAQDSPVLRAVAACLLLEPCSTHQSAQVWSRASAVQRACVWESLLQEPWVVRGISLDISLIPFSHCGGTAWTSFAFPSSQYVHCSQRSYFAAYPTGLPLWRTWCCFMASRGRCWCGRMGVCLLSLISSNTEPQVACSAGSCWLDQRQA
jgi:hypothetical protein